MTHRLEVLREAGIETVHDLHDGMYKDARWKEEEEEALVAQLARGVAVKDIKVGSRSAGSIESRLHHLRKQASAPGAKVDDATGAALAKKKVDVKWTADEDASLLAQLRSGVAVKSISIGGRSAGSIRNRLRRLRKHHPAAPK